MPRPGIEQGTPCGGCRRPMYRNRFPEPGLVRCVGRGLCGRCYRRRRLGQAARVAVHALPSDRWPARA